MPPRMTTNLYAFFDLPIGVTMKKMLKTSAEGRKCVFPNCTHILSIYNHEAYCRIHLGQILQEQKPEILTPREFWWSKVYFCYLNTLLLTLGPLMLRKRCQTEGLWAILILLSSWACGPFFSPYPPATLFTSVPSLSLRSLSPTGAGIQSSFFLTAKKPLQSV